LIRLGYLIFSYPTIFSDVFFDDKLNYLIYTNHFSVSMLILSIYRA